MTGLNQNRTGDGAGDGDGEDIPDCKKTPFLAPGGPGDASQGLQVWFSNRDAGCKQTKWNCCPPPLHPHFLGDETRPVQRRKVPAKAQCPKATARKTRAGLSQRNHPHPQLPESPQQPRPRSNPRGGVDQAWGLRGHVTVQEPYAPFPRTRAHRLSTTRHQKDGGAKRLMSVRVTVTVWVSASMPLLTPGSCVETPVAASKR